MKCVVALCTIESKQVEPLFGLLGNPRATPVCLALHGKTRRQYLDTNARAQRETKYLSVLNLLDESPIENVSDVAADLPGTFAGDCGIGAFVLRS